MSEIIRTEINYKNHGLIGVNDVVYEYDIFLKRGMVKIGDNPAKELNVEECKELKKLLIGEDEFDQKLNKIKQIAADCSEIPLFRIYEKTRKENVVFARYLIMWFARKILSYSQEKTALIFDMDRCSGIHAYKLVNDFMKNNDNIKFLKHDQKRWANNFILKIKDLK